MPEKSEQVKALEWLLDEKREGLRRNHRRGGGFSVSGRLKITRKNGEVAGLVDALLDKGFTEGVEIGDYRVSYNEASHGYAHSLAFFLMTPVIDAGDVF